MTTQQFLASAWDIDRRIERRIEERDRLQARLEAGRSANLTGMPRGGSSDWTITADRVIELDRQLAQEIAELCRLKRLVNEAIDAVEDLRCRELLEYRYRNGYTWAKVAEAMDIEERSAYYMHKRALELVKIPDEFR